MKTELLAQLSKIILEYKKDFPVLVGIDGVDASGKTTLAENLARLIEEQSSRKVIRSSIDSFHNQREIRYKKGRSSPEGYYNDSFNYKALKECLLNSLYSGELKYKDAFFDYRIDKEVNVKEKTADKDAILIMEGIFLFRPEIIDYWDIKIFLDVDFSEVIKRVTQREKDQESLGSKEEIMDQYEKRYIPGQNLYFKEANPKEKADIVINNNDYNNPIIIKG